MNRRASWRTTHRATVVAMLTTAGAGTAAAQGFRGSFDMRGQSVSTRGWLLDSIPQSQAQVGPGGGLYSPAGDAVACSSPAYCYYYAPGPQVQYAPLVFTTDMTAWGLGTPGLSAHVNMRMNFNAGDDPFAGTVPEFQLWEGYARYQHDWFMVQAGRQTLTSRLGFAGFDGGRATLRYASLGLEATGYVGIGLARASSVGINNVVTAPLDDYIPGERNLLAGVVLGLNMRAVEARFEWQRQVDRTTDYLMSDYLTATAVVRPAMHFAIAGDADYNLAQAQVGSADLELRYSASRLYITGGYKRYMPRFDLWSIWPAFSPIGWDGVQGSVQYTPVRWLTLRGRIQWYDYQNTGAETALGSAAPTGMLWSAGATVTAIPRWTFDAGWMYDNSFGAATAGGDASIGWAPINSLAVRLYGAYSNRPLVYRYEDTYLTWAGFDVSLRATQQMAVGASVVYINQNESRPDASGYEWNQARISAYVTYAFSAGGADRLRLPDAVKRMPSSVGYER